MLLLSVSFYMTRFGRDVEEERKPSKVKNSTAHVAHILFRKLHLYLGIMQLILYFSI